MQAHQFLRREQVLQKLGISRTTLYNLEKAGRFPQHFMVTPRCAAWRADEVDAWMQQRAGVSVPSAPAPDVRQRRHAPGRGKRQQAAA
ncbi:helix-turn-helix transcriptional regulator [Dyella agri]|uniref:AlpA family phage regulatory protein n=1 Tax=Dyella agri TaxID=1926869 RepID=A0ABW8KK50_9GAMM